MSDAVIIDVVRTASGRGKPGGALSSVHPATLLSTVLTAIVERSGLDPARVDDVIAGCVQQIWDQAGNIARTGALGAGFPESVPGVTINRQCGSSQQAAAFAAQGVLAGVYDIVIACGVESMSRVPLGSPKGDDVWGPQVRARYPAGLVNQGVSAELVAHKWKLDRASLDEFSAASHQRAARAIEQGVFERDLVPVAVPGEDGTVREHRADETVRPATSVVSLAGLKPSFGTPKMAERYPEIEWSITPGNSSPLTDGASAVLIMSEEKAAELGLTPRARFHAMSVAGDDPLLMLTAPIPATRKVLARSGLQIDDLDVYEVNEAFAPVPLAWARELAADPAKLNPWGGAISLGHALGSSGTRLLGTMVEYLEHAGGRYGLQTMCEAGGLANAYIIERLG